MQTSDLFGEIAICTEMGWGHERDWLALSRTDRAKLIAWYGVAEYIRGLDREDAEREALVRSMQ